MDISARPEIDAHRVRQLFERAPSDSFVADEVGSRMAERLDLVKLDPALILEAGRGGTRDRLLLENRYPKAICLSAQMSRPSLAPAPREGVLMAAIGRVLGKARTLPFLVARPDALPFSPAVFDVVYSNLLLPWVADAEPVVAEWARILKPGGLLMFSAFGPDTLAEVRLAFAAVDDLDHTIAFTDLHDYGDMLASHGFAAPVMDMERITLTHADAGKFWDDVRALGGNPLLSRRRGLLGRAAALRMNQALERQRDAKGRLALTFEVVYGHAWKGDRARRTDGLSVVAPPPRKKP
jgi:malonyl-CoA O-methyltransferase